MPNRKKWIRYVLYAVEILLLFLLQDTPGLLPQIMGVKPLPVLSAALTIAMVEACTPAMAFGMYAGFLADIGSGAVFGYHALTFGVLCFLLSGLCGTRIQIQLFTSVLMGLWSCAVAVLLDWLALYVAAGYSLTLYALVTKAQHAERERHGAEILTVNAVTGIALVLLANHAGRIGRALGFQQLCRVLVVLFGL